jgi:hypothetical protein
MNAKDAGKQLAGQAEALAKVLKDSNPMGDKSQSKKPTKSGARSKTPNKEVDKLRARVAQLERTEADRKETTPTISLGREDVALVFHGKIAGKACDRRAPFVMGERAMLLKPLLEPIVAVANGALRGKQMEAMKVLSDDEYGKYYKTTALQKAAFAYDALLNNDAFIQKLTELNEVIEDVYQQVSHSPHQAEVVTRDDATGKLRYMTLQEYTSGRQSFKDGFTASQDKTEEQTFE